MKTKKILALMLGLMMIFSLLPSMNVFAADPVAADYETGSASYLDENGEGQTVTDAYIVTSSQSECDVKWEAGVYAVTDDATINGSVVLNGAVTILLKDGATLTVNGAVYAPGDSAGFAITLFGQENGTGKLKVTGAVLDGIYRAVSVKDLTVNGGVLDASLSDTDELTPEEAVYAMNITVNGGTVYATCGDVFSEAKNNGYSVYNTAIDCSDLTVNGGTVCATSGDAWDELEENNSVAVDVTRLTVNGGKLVATCRAEYAEGKCDIDADFATITGGTVESARDSKAVGVAIKQLNVSGGSIKLERIMDVSSIYEINVSESVTLADLLAEGYGFYCDGDFVNTEGLTKLGEIDSGNKTGAEIWILKYGETMDELKAKDACAVVTWTMGYYNGKYGVQTDTYLYSAKYVFDALTDPEVESITLLKDIYVTGEEISYLYEEEPTMNADYCLTVGSKRLTLDLNGHSLTLEDDEALLKISDKMLIKDSSKAKNGKLEMNYICVYDSSAFTSSYPELNANLTIESGNVNTNMTAVVGGQLTVSGGKIKSEYQIGGIYGKIRLTGGEIASAMNLTSIVLEVTGGKITQPGDSRYDGIRIRDGNVVSISGGEICSTLYIEATSSAIQINGGEFQEIYGKTSGNIMALTLLAPGFAYFDAEDDSLIKDGYTEHLENVIVKPHSCEFEEETDDDEEPYYVCACGRVKMDATGTEENAVAKIVYTDKHGDEQTFWAASITEIMDVICRASIAQLTRITLLDDVSLSDQELDEDDYSTISIYGESVIDLNGHTLDLTFSDEEGETTSRPSVSVIDGTGVVITDSSADKKGAMKIGNLEIESLGNLTVNGGTLLSEGEGLNIIYGRLAVAGGTADFGTNETFVSRGSVTVSDGVLKCSEIYLGYEDYVSPQSLEEDESEAELPFDWNMKLTEAIDTGDNMLISGGELKGSVYLYSNNSLRITGGKISDLAKDDKSFIWSGGGELTVTGGEIATLGVMTGEYTKAGFTLLSGGTFENIFLDGGTEADMRGFLADGCAYYKTNADTVVRPAVYVDEDYGEMDDVYFVSNVTVKNHTCTYNASGLCACGRIGAPNVEAVPYLDENGNEKQAMSYKLLTGEEEKLTNGWYVVKGNVSFNGSVTVEGTDVHLILTDDSTLTVNGKIANGEKEAALTVYGQKKNTGVLSASGAAHSISGDVDYYATYTGIYLDNFTVNGGTVNVLLNQTEYYSSDAIYAAYSIVINGGCVNARGADITVPSQGSSSYGIYADCNWNGVYNKLEINGGTVNASGGDITATGLGAEYTYLESCGIGADEYTVISGGVVTAQGGSITADSSNEIDAYSEGIYIYNMEISGGVVNAIGGDTVVSYTGDNEDTGHKCCVQSNGIYSWGKFILTGGALNVALGSAKATGTGTRSTSSGIRAINDTLTVGGGTITVTGEPKNKTDQTIGIYADSLEISGGTVNVMSEGLDDDLSAYELQLTGGTVKNGKTGALKLWCDWEIIYGGGEMKLGALRANTLESQSSDISLTELLADGYCFYTGGGEWVDSDTNVQQLSGGTVIGYEPVDVSLAAGSTENKASFNISELDSVLGTASYYKVTDFNDEVVSATVDEETGVLTVSPAEAAEAGNDTAVIVKISYQSGYVMYLQVNVLLTDKTVPTVTLNNSTIEKVYDGEAIDPSAIASVATVTANDETVAGEWQWQSNVPKNVSDGFVTACFVPDDSEAYATVTVNVPVKITAKTVSGEPSYQEISESGKTLADAKLSANSAWPKGNLCWVDDKGTELSSETVVAENTAYSWRFTPASANYASAEGSITLYSVSTGGSSGKNHSSGSNSSTTKNPDGSTTTVTENKTNGTITETTKNPDGSTTKVETRKDGTVTTTEKDKQGNTVTTVEEANGGVTTTEKRKDGTTVTTVTDENGTTKSEIKTKNEAEVIIPVDDADDVTKIIVTDEDGNTTEITEFEKTENGIVINVSGNSTVEISREKVEEAQPADKPESNFGDVSGHWAEKAIGYVVENGLMRGVSDTEFAPNAELTRAMLVTILYRAAGSPAVNKSIPFADVTADSYYADAVIWAQQNEIVSGMSESEFAPDENITREQIATILYRFAKAMGYDVSAAEDTNILSYTDAEDISEYAIEAMQYAVGSGLLNGKTESTLNPKDNATRGEIATILQRFIEANK